VHSNSPRDALSRLETMVLMAGFELPVRAIREQIAAAINLIMHLDRMPDGRRVVTSVTEIQGMEGDTILLQDIFKYRMFARSPSENGTPKVNGELVSAGLRPKFLDKLAEAGVAVPAKVFRTAPPPASSTRLRSSRVPDPSTLARPERARG
jgi:pilus assembly protein CpaF